MDTVYILLVRWGTEWDGQSIYRTKSKAWFDFVNNRYEDAYFPDFPVEVQNEIRAKYAEQALQYPELTSDDLDEEMGISEAMEWLDSYGEDYNKFPVILGGTGELTCQWNW
jgi:hypothetical protein